MATPRFDEMGLFTGIIVQDFDVGVIQGERLCRDTLNIFRHPQRLALQIEIPHLIVQNTPKTRSSYRETSISGDLCELLVRHIFTMAKPFSILDSIWNFYKNIS